MPIVPHGMIILLLFLGKIMRHFQLSCAVYFWHSCCILLAFVGDLSNWHSTDRGFKRPLPEPSTEDLDTEDLDTEDLDAADLDTGRRMTCQLITSFFCC